MKPNDKREGQREQPDEKDQRIQNDGSTPRDLDRREAPPPRNSISGGPEGITGKFPGREVRRDSPQRSSQPGN